MTGALKRSTPNYNIPVPKFDETAWQGFYEQGVDIIDAAMFAFTGINVNKGVWDNGTAYTINDRAVDADNGTLWACLVTHTSASSGTFAADRTANSSYWGQITSTAINGGTWTTSTAYVTNTYIEDGYRVGVVTNDYTSGASYNADVSNGDIVTLVDLTSQVAPIAAISSEITTVAGIDTEVTTVAGDSADIQTVAGIASEITTVAAVDTEITMVSGISGNVATVAGISGDVTTVAGISVNVTTVAGISANVTTVAGDSADIQALGPISADISAAAAIDADISAVAADATDIGTVSTNITPINTCATNISDIIDAAALFDGFTAADVANVAAGNIVATNVQAAINELDGEKVAGPASATDSAVAQFDGTTGKLLKNGLLVGTSANNLVQLDGSGNLPAVDGSALTGIDTGGWTQIGQTVIGSPVAAVEFTSIPQTYGILFVEAEDVSHTSGSNSEARAEVSADNGSTYPLTFDLNSGAYSQFSEGDGTIAIIGPQNNLGIAVTGPAPSRQSNATKRESNRNAYLWRLDGGIDAIRVVSSSGGNLDKGTITVYGL
jgi:hypothetical protein